MTMLDLYEQGRNFFSNRFERYPTIVEYDANQSNNDQDQWMLEVTS
jgi:hypothetical protein